MGFRVEIHGGNKSKLLRHLRLSPAEVFKKSYGGYLFFLMGNPDEEAVNWLSENIISLDSMTAEHIAFAIFAKSVKMKIKVHNPMRGSPNRAEKKFNIPIEEIREKKTVEQLVKNWRHGWVIDGDEINAMTYAVDEIARNFGVLNELPCVLILDAIPNGKFYIYRTYAKVII